MIDNKPNYYAIIPAEVRYSDISANAKLLYGEITALCNKHGYCWATNKYFANLYGVHPVTVSGWINQLSKKGFITTQIIQSDNSLEVLRKILIPLAKTLRGVSKNTKTPISENTKENNTSINNTINNNVEIQSIYDHFIKKFNKNPNTYKLTDQRKRKIKARLKDAGSDMLTKAIDNTAVSEFHRGENDRGWCADLDFIIRSYEQVERLAAMNEASAKLSIAVMQKEMQYVI